MSAQPKPYYLASELMRAYGLKRADVPKFFPVTTFGRRRRYLRENVERVVAEKTFAPRLAESQKATRIPWQKSSIECANELRAQGLLTT